MGAIVARARKADRLLGVTYNYSGYPMVRHARSLIAEQAIGAVRIVQAEFALGWLAVALEREGVKQAWRTDPKQAGPSGVVADIGTHVHHLTRFVTGLEIESLAADISTFVPLRQLEDNATIMLRYKGGAAGHLWASMVAAGETVGLRLRVYGDKGHIAWDQGHPDDYISGLSTEPTKRFTAAARSRRLRSPLPDWCRDCLKGSSRHSPIFIGIMRN